MRAMAICSATPRPDEELAVAVAAGDRGGDQRHHLASERANESRDVGADRVVFGTDLPFDMADVRFKEYFSTARLDAAALDAVTRSNALFLFRLKT